MKFLVVGDEMIDRYYIGSITRLNPEKHSAPLLSYHDILDRPGGAGNVASNIRGMGAEANLVSQGDGMPIKCRLLDENDGIVARFDHDEPCTPAHMMDIGFACAHCCAVIVSDYGKGAINSRVADQIKELGLPTFVDAKVSPERWASWCTAMLPNSREYEAHKSVYDKALMCVIKQGFYGAELRINAVSWAHRFPSVAKHIKNVSGAGDTVVAAFAMSYMATNDAALSVEVAMDFAAAAVENPLTASPSFGEAYPGGIPTKCFPILTSLGKCEQSR